MKEFISGYYVDINGDLCHASIDYNGMISVHNTDENTYSLYNTFPFKDYKFLGSSWADIGKEVLKALWKNYSKFND